MGDERTPDPSRRVGSFPLQDRQLPSRRHRNDSLRQFAENVRHVPPQNRDRVHFVAEPEELGATTAAYPHVRTPDILPAARVGEAYINLQNAYAHSTPMHHASPFSRFQAADTLPADAVPWVDQERGNRRSTGDSYLSDRERRGMPMRNGPGRVRFLEPETQPRRSYSQSPPPPVDVYARDKYIPDSSPDSSSSEDYGYDTPTASYHNRSRSRSRSRPHTRKHRIYQSSYASDLDEDDEEGFDEMLGGKVFQFVPSRTSRALSKSGHSIETDVSLEKSEDGVSNARSELSIPPNSNILHVYQSQYTGDAVAEGTHTARLTVVHDAKKQRQPLFRWMHLEQRMMNLDELATEVSRIPAITDTERNGFAKLIAEVKKNCVKVRPTTKGNHVKHMDPKPVRVAIPPDGRTKDQTLRSLTWLCVPYFSLEKYSGLLSASTTSSFPVETLLQSEYARTTQERDMQQAVCQNGEAPDGYCFHIAQLWCIVLDNSLLVTCGRMSSSALRGDLVRIVNEPLKEPGGKVKRLYVSYYDSFLWALSLDSCSTWFDFLIHFRDFWPRPVKFYYHNQVVIASDWSRIVNTVKNTNTKVTLDLRLWIHPHPPDVGVLRPLGKEIGEAGQGNLKTGQNKNENTQSKPPNGVDTSFHVFSWLAMAEAETGDTELDAEALTTDLQEAEQYLLGSTAMGNRNAYQRCSQSTQSSVYDYLETQGSKIEKNNGESREESRNRREYETRVDLYNAAEIIFSFFLPQSLGIGAPTVGKFWGAIRSLVEIPNANDDDDTHPQRDRQPRRYPVGSYDAYPLRSALRGLTRVVQSFQDILSHAPTPIRLKIEVPDTLICAWLHLVMAVIQASLSDETWNENIFVAEALMQRGMADIMAELPTQDLLSNAVIQPMELLALVSSKLLQDSTGTYSSINDTYSDYLKGLENEITTNNSDRSHQLRITLFNQEVEVIRRVVASQLRVVAAMTMPQRPGDQTRREKEMLDKEREKSNFETSRMRSRFLAKQGAAYVDNSDVYGGHQSYSHRSVSGLPGPHFASPARDLDSFSRLASTDPGGFRELLGRECRSWLERREEEFSELDIEASRLETMNANKIEFTKDRQEAAVYAFTMVTIIFLPLSTISSIFGMNSSDVRDMELGQWAYWAAALPTTVAVILLGLWWMGELHNLVNWVRGSPSRTARGPAGVSRPTANGVMYYAEGDYPGIDTQTIRPYSRATLGPPPVPRRSWRY
ncbi:hypothetical protein GGS26DRAFT_56879 [Hypomontagnella submonticulosa]|nr:hypothetical protein GGS26DRAFT_56879 [Hypomontagnella submonticulosa]